jgi:hypothetical protein
MKKALLTAVILSVLLGGITFAQSEADLAYTKAMTANTPQEKANLLKAYIANFAGTLVPRRHAACSAGVGGCAADDIPGRTRIENCRRSNGSSAGGGARRGRAWTCGLSLTHESLQPVPSVIT